MIEFGNFYQLIAKNHLSHWLETLPAQIASWQREQQHGLFKQWSNAVEFLPEMTPWRLDLLHSVTAESETPLSEGQGSGYHLWRMIGAGAHLAVGIDPTQLFLCQFEAVRKLLGNDQRAHLLPLGIEQLPALKAFDTVFSMGVLYHRRSPLEHLWQLKDQLVNEGELVLETLVIDGDENTVLVPGDRYAQMRNVYFIPSAPALKKWLEKCGFIDVRIADVCVTTTEEQRRTEWMVTESLAGRGARGGQRCCGLKYEGEKKAPVELAGAWYEQASYWAT